MNSTEAGMVSGALETPLSAIVPMDLTLSGRFRLVRPIAKKNALLPMVSRPSGRVMEVVFMLK